MTGVMKISGAHWNSWSFPGGDAWSPWKVLSPALKIRDRPGAYVIGLPASRAPLGRLRGADPHGILDIGESAKLARRISDLRRCAEKPGERGHMAGWRLGSGGLLKHLGITSADLRVSYCYAEPASKDEAYRLEGTILRGYFDLFGELPPLNYKFNWSAWVDDA
ncbi:MAG: hypothetical protein AMXMBFR56_63820 [Polyangiaceae bacterium]